MKLKRKIAAVIIMMSLVFSMYPMTLDAVCGTGSVNAASKYKLTGDQAKDVVGIAASCQGMKLNAAKKRLKSYGKKMYKEGYAYDWCAWFAANCAREAGVKKSVLPNFTYADGSKKAVNGYYEWAKKNKLYRKKSKYTPKPGDLALFGTSTSNIYHVEIVASVSKNGKTVKTIGGNTGNNYWEKSVVSKPRKRNDIIGYVEIKYPNSTAASSFEVTEDQYNSTYKNNSSYKLVGTKTYYRTATWSKITTTSGYDTLDGWTKYDTKTTTSTSGYKFGTPVSSSTSYADGKKTVTSAVNSGYYYYAYTAANPGKTSEWTYYADTSRKNVISHMKKNFSKSSAWGESRLRYFWYISSSDLGSMSKKMNQKINYCEDSTVSKGTTSSSGTHLYDLKLYKYKRCYKVKTVVTTNYFSKGGWKWGNWTTTNPGAVDSSTTKVESQVRYIVQKVK